MRIGLLGAAVGAAMLSVLSSPATAADSYGPFKVDPNQPTVLRLNGEIAPGSALAFRRALSANPKIDTVVLNSDGGLVDDGLLIADDVHQRKLATFIADGERCYSACAYIFFAGAERLAKGELGVHQISAKAPDLSSAQMSISDIIEQLTRFGTPIEVLTVMFRTPADDMHVFSPDEIERFAINRGAADPTSTVAARAPSSTIDELQAARPAAIEPAEPALDGAPSRKIAALEEYARMPDRIALFTGLDFFGADMRQTSVVDAASCARECLLVGSECKAFTFNIKTGFGRGPNCFLKSSKGRADGNSAAISGELLARSAAAPPPYTMGVIDPETSIVKNVDLFGDDLSSRPYAKAKTAQQCRLSCVSNSRCMAYTFAASTKACWLKRGVGTPRPAEGVVSGVKTFMTVRPASIVSLD